VFELCVETEFAAAHAIVMSGQREPLHGHNWRVTATLSGPALDRDGLLCDFHLVESSLRDVTGRWHNRNLNEAPPFSDGLNPSAEQVARQIADELGAALAGRIPGDVRVSAVRVTEAPGCSATYRPEP
jgi:6-pyruvoyltetrahydropterin/6-carboxytetrahydropterin synthase